MSATSVDKAVGYCLILLAGLIFTYYSLWVIVLPFVEPQHIIHSFFLPRFYAVAGPLAAGVIALSLIGGFIMYTNFTKKVKKS